MRTHRPYLAATFIWLSVVAVFFWPALFQGRVIAPLDILDSLLRPWAINENINVHNAFAYDAISQYLPYDYSVYQSLQHDGYIGWNPFTHSGSSIAENTMISPGDWHHQLYRFLPFWTAWNLGIILQFTLAGIGMLCFLRDREIPAACALVGVVSFAFYSQFILWIHHRWVLGAMCWAPWILWSLFRAKKQGRFVDLPSIFFIALAFRGGHLQSCVFVVFLVASLTFVDWLDSPKKWQLKYSFRLLLPYAISGFLGAVFAMDIFIETIPPFLLGCKQMPERPWVQTLIAIPTLITTWIPTLLGTPQGLDINKFFKADLFSIKFLGATATALALIALLAHQAPRHAKFLFILGLVLPFTPADKWLYSRFSVIFALGAAWMAAWQLAQLAHQPRKAFYKYGWLALGTAILVWLFLSAGITWKEDWIQPRIVSAVLSHLELGKISRSSWMLHRTTIFLEECKIWYPRNLAFLSLIGLGWFALSQVRLGNKKSQAFAVLVALATFGEVFLFSSTWITFSNRPLGQGLYSEPSWATLLKHEVGSGKVVCYDRSEFDYLQLNTPSVYGIVFAEGYETVTPSRINPLPSKDWDPRCYANAGISHLLVSPKRDPGSISGWEKVVDSKEFTLYRNSAFVGTSILEMASGQKLSIQPTKETPNLRVFDLPAGAKAITLLQSFNSGWRFSLNGDAWQPVQKTPLFAMQIPLDSFSLSNGGHLLIQYKPAHQTLCRIIIGGLATTLLFLEAYRWFLKHHLARLSLL